MAKRYSNRQDLGHQSELLGPVGEPRPRPEIFSSVYLNLKNLFSGDVSALHQILISPNLVQATFHFDLFSLTNDNDMLSDQDLGWLLWLGLHAPTFVYTHFSRKQLGRWLDAFTGFVSTGDAAAGYNWQGAQHCRHFDQTKTLTFKEGFASFRDNFPDFNRHKSVAVVFNASAKPLLEVCSLGVCVNRRDHADLNKLALVVLPSKQSLWALFDKVARLRATNAAENRDLIHELEEEETREDHRMELVNAELISIKPDEGN